MQQDAPLEEPAGFSELSKSEQIEYLQTLWDKLSANPDDVPVPASHLDLAEARLARYRDDPAAARPAHEILDRLGRKS